MRALDARVAYTEACAQLGDAVTVRDHLADQLSEADQLVNRLSRHCRELHTLATRTVNVEAMQAAAARELGEDVPISRPLTHRDPLDASPPPLDEAAAAFAAGDLSKAFAPPPTPPPPRDPAPKTGRKILPPSSTETDS